MQGSTLSKYIFVLFNQYLDEPSFLKVIDVIILCGENPLLFTRDIFLLLYIWERHYVIMKYLTISQNKFAMACIDVILVNVCK